jgi:transcriptional regulator with XRE-family HTH domain
MPASIAALLYEARRTLRIGSQGKLGVRIGSSARSGQRWERGEASPSARQLQELAGLVYPKNASLAAEIASAGGTTVEALGLAPASPVKPRPDTEHIVDTVVCAASDAMGALPEAVRPALLAAFRRARLVGLTMEEVESALGGKAAASAAAPKKKEGASKKVAS